MTSSINEIVLDTPPKTSLSTTCQQPAQMSRRGRWSTSSTSFPPTFSTSPMASHLVWLSNFSIYTLFTSKLKGFQASWCPSSARRRIPQSSSGQVRRASLSLSIMPQPFSYPLLQDKCRSYPYPYHTLFLPDHFLIQKHP